VSFNLFFQEIIILILNFMYLIILLVFPIQQKEL